jgi:hypothetical protein
VNPSFVKILQVPLQDRRDLFLGAANRLGTPEANIEKDFWVCWTLDALFNPLHEGHPRLLFKGGTSLSKAYGLISRFSEDIDITVFREDIGQQVSIAEFEALSRKKRQARLDAIKGACREYIQGSLCDQLNNSFQEVALAAGIDRTSASFAHDDQDPDGQSLLFLYPSVTSGHEEYIRRAIKIESGAKSALDPHEPVTISPYVADDLPTLSLAVPNITTVVAERTFWDKVIIIHGVRQWFEKRGVLRHLGQRVSRHYYDIHRMMQGAETMQIQFISALQSLGLVRFPKATDNTYRHPRARRCGWARVLETGFLDEWIECADRDRGTGQQRTDTRPP